MYQAMSLDGKAKGDVEPNVEAAVASYQAEFREDPDEVWFCRPLGDGSYEPDRQVEFELSPADLPE